MSRVLCETFIYQNKMLDQDCFRLIRLCELYRITATYKEKPVVLIILCYPCSPYVSIQKFSDNPLFRSCHCRPNNQLKQRPRSNTSEPKKKENEREKKKMKTSDGRRSKIFCERKVVLQLSINEAGGDKLFRKHVRRMKK